MKIINNEEKKVTIVLEEEDELEITSLYGNKEKIMVKCLNASLHIDELLVSKIKEKAMEEKEIKKMQDYLAGK